MINKLRNIKASVKANLVNRKGWKTNRKLIVIESDDWGAIRMPSKDVFSDFKSKGFNISNSVYNKYDSLASENDLEKLFNLLIKFKDNNGVNLKFTANTIVANPDFNKIRDDNFEIYHYEIFTETLNEYPEHKDAFKLWKKGIDEKIFKPQFHGREHLNVDLWMKELKNNNDKVRYCFDKRTTYSGEGDYNFMEAYDNDISLLSSHEKIIADGLRIFKEIFGYNSDSFIAPCYVWHSKLNKVLKENMITVLQGNRKQLEPTKDLDKHNLISHVLGEKNKYDQLYLIRNVYFEPTLSKSVDWVNYAMAQISAAFFWNKPAIISSHRLNYIGYLNSENRDKNLKLLDELITKVQNKWQDVEFVTSDELGKIITND